jgi:hypothetical protein
MSPGAFDPTSWTALIVALGLGLLAAALVYVAGRYLFGAREAPLEDADSFNLEARRETAEEEEVDVFMQGATNDRRRALRRGGNPVAVLITDVDCKSEAAFGFVLDRSTGGLCLSVKDEIPEGTVVSVRTTNAPPTVPWVQVEVRNCRKINSEEYELGCKFVRTPPWSVLLLFG